MSIEHIYKIYLKSSGVCTDTRQVVENSLFFALRGDQFDGNRFVEDALDKGCRLALTERRDLEGNEKVAVVVSCLTSLQQLAHSPQPAIVVMSFSAHVLEDLWMRQYQKLLARHRLDHAIG